MRTAGTRWAALWLVLAVAVTGCASGAAGRPAAPESVRVALPSRTMTAGSQMLGRVVVDNNTGHALYAKTCQGLFAVVLSSRSYHPTSGAPAVACKPTRAIPAGRSSYPVTVQATYLACSVNGTGGGFRLCLPHMKLPPLPAGTYQATLDQPGVVPEPPAITIRVTSPQPG